MTAEEKWRIKADILLRWIRLEQSGVFLEDLLRKRRYKNVGVYGYISLTDCIVYELKDSKEIDLKGIVDRKGGNILIDFPAFFPEEMVKLNLDVLILMPVDDYEMIKEQIHKYTNADIRSIEDILYEL